MTVTEQSSHSDWAPQACPITGRPFFMWIEHHQTGRMVPTYGGPYDSYTLPVRDGDGFVCERFDHDQGGWLIDCLEDVGVRLVDDQSLVIAPDNQRYEEIEAFANNAEIGKVAAYQVSAWGRWVTTNKNGYELMKRRDPTAVRKLFLRADPLSHDVGVLLAFAQGRINHLNRQDCPDEVAGPNTRDPDCPVCQAIIRLSKVRSAMPLELEPTPATDKKPVARLHITSTDTYPDIEVEVMDGAALQPQDSPVDVYLIDNELGVISRGR